MKKVYKLTPALKDNLWGGVKLKGYGKDVTAPIIAESWELSFTKGGEARIEDGRTLTEAFPRDTWGSACDKFEFFPTLTKFIDARENLSVQVHPGDDYALEHEGQYGKSEMWYVVEADEGAGIYMGLKDKCSPELFAAKVADGTVEEVLSFKEVKAGDVYFIPAGTVHAIGAGVVIFEIQQNSTLTYRLYDYQRVGADGKMRELHVDKAMLVSTLDRYEAPTRDGKDPTLIGICKYFETHKYKLEFTKLSIPVTSRSFLSLTCTKGEGVIEGEPFVAGDTYFVPKGVGEVEISGDCEIITVSVPV